MEQCRLCGNPIKPDTRTVELVGGFFQHEEGLEEPFFVHDLDVMPTAYVHLECLLACTRTRADGA